MQFQPTIVFTIYKIIMASIDPYDASVRGDRLICEERFTIIWI